MFGTANTSTPSFFGSSFGNPAPTPAQPSLFGGFGSSATGTAPSFGTSFGGFGAPTTTTAPSTGFFGLNTQSQPPQQASLFSGFGQQAQPQQPTSLFGNSSLFGTTTQQQQPTAGSFFGASVPAQLAVSSEADYAARLAACVQNPFLFGDERDQILAKFNAIQATMGCGKAYYAHNQPPLDMNSENVFCKWKCIVYMPKLERSNEEGVVRLIFTKTGTDVYDVRSELAELLHKLLGERPNIQVEIDGVNPLPNDKSELLFHVLERQNDGGIRRIPSGDLHAFLTQPQQKANLQSMQVENVQPKLVLTKEMEKQALEKVPPGISSYAWFQAQKDNPDPENLFPVPVIGFMDMYDLLKKESALAALSKDTCMQIEADVRQLEKKVEENKQLASGYQEKLDRFTLRQLHVSSTLPTISRLGHPLTAFETNLCDQVNQMKGSLEAPEKNLKNRTHELNANILLHDRFLAERSKRQPRIDTKSLSETEKDNMGKACELLISILDACKDKIKEEKELLTKLLYEETS